MNTTTTAPPRSEIQAMAATAAPIAPARDRLMNSPRFRRHRKSPQPGIAQGRRAVLRLATCLMVVVASLGTLFTSTAPASAAVTDFGARCSWGKTYVTVGVSARQAISNGYQLVSVRYVIQGVRGWTIDTGYTPAFWAPKAGTAYDFETIYTGSFGDAWQEALVNVAYWDGIRWTYDPSWLRMNVSGCWR